MTIIIFLMKNLIKEMPLQMKNTVIGTAIAIFAFRAVPNIGPGNGWFEIDILGFDIAFSGHFCFSTYINFTCRIFSN